MAVATESETRTAGAGQGAVTVPAPVDDGWLAWITVNRLRECSVQSMQDAMVGAGLGTAAAQHAIRTIRDNPMYQVAERLYDKLAKLESMVGNLQKVWESSPGYSTVERRSGISDETFVRDHVMGHRPVVLTDLTTDWPANKRWTPQQLKERFGDVTIQVQSGRDRDPDYEVHMGQLRTDMRMGDFVDRVLSLGEGNDLYLTASNQAMLSPGMESLFDDIGSMPSYLDRNAMAGAMMLWFGPAATRTPFHHDQMMLFHTQIVGRKHWRLVSPLETSKLDNYLGVYSHIDLDNPDYTRFPELANVKVIDVIVEPGETLFLPLGWWHQVRSLDVCVSLSFTNLAIDNTFKWRNPEPRV